jgi:hypothetical protein
VGVAILTLWAAAFVVRALIRALSIDSQEHQP